MTPINCRNSRKYKLLCQGENRQIFGRKNFVATNIWQKRYSRENREAIGDVHEYLIVYALDPERFKSVRNRIGLTEDQAKIYKNPNNDPRGRWRGIPMTAQGYRPNQMYAITTPAGVVHPPPEGRCWSMVEEEFLKLRQAGRIYFGKDDKAQPSVIRKAYPSGSGEAIGGGGTRAVGIEQTTNLCRSRGRYDPCSGLPDRLPAAFSR